MTEQDQILTDALKKASSLVAEIDDRYREVAFPIVLQTLIGGVMPASTSNQGAHDENGAAAPRLSPNLSVNEFFRLVKPETHNARFVCAAYYLFHTGKVEQFTQADILEIYQKLRQQQPKNPTDVMNQCIRKAHIIDAPDNGDKQKRWVITPEGEKFVEALLNGNANSNS